MAEDGLLFRILSRINARTKTPLLATIASGIVAGRFSFFWLCYVNLCRLSCLFMALGLVLQVSSLSGSLLLPRLFV